ncbi:9394_t:CDS:1 [Entrophospora sp. SA101]|nr:13973_t:CDS:1 [Entrophospora sp. SA101]CAJ0637757.1 4236_t:CDS:1 [Entrophospora sp. SA101]CAJ0754997.1 23794_t:CDS:1 [Entrophospora sp. SA101]CAJ0765327.1 9394_t:CDS:1 [Entrophospora sp. SA101]CAJ0825191.1 758_t:CDS:1 [Entrophospora sp. SA101]
MASTTFKDFGAIGTKKPFSKAVGDMTGLSINKLSGYLFNPQSPILSSNDPIIVADNKKPINVYRTTSSKPSTIVNAFKRSVGVIGEPKSSPISIPTPKPSIISNPFCWDSLLGDQMVDSNGMIIDQQCDNGTNEILIEGKINYGDGDTNGVGILNNNNIINPGYNILERYPTLLDFPSDLSSGSDCSSIDSTSPKNDKLFTATLSSLCKRSSDYDDLIVSLDQSPIKDDSLLTSLLFYDDDDDCSSSKAKIAKRSLLTASLSPSSFSSSSADTNEPTKNCQSTVADTNFFDYPINSSDSSNKEKSTIVSSGDTTTTCTIDDDNNNDNTKYNESASSSLSSSPSSSSTLGKYDSDDPENVKSTTNTTANKINQRVRSNSDPAKSTISSDSSTTSNESDKEQKKAILYKTEMCRNWEELGTCRYGPRCQFAHAVNELRPVAHHPKYKTEICKTFWDKGTCPYGKRCCFVHNVNSKLIKGLTKTASDPLLHGSYTKNLTTDTVRAFADAYFSGNAADAPTSSVIQSQPRRRVSTSRLACFQKIAP